MKVTDEMVSRFLGWKLPENFSPDAGISFKPMYNEHMPWGGNKHEPVGTNLLDADQARQMLEHVLGGSTEQPAGPSVFNDWCARWFGADADETYLARAVADLPAQDA